MRRHRGAAIAARALTLHPLLVDVVSGGVWGHGHVGCAVRTELLFGGQLSLPRIVGVVEVVVGTVLLWAWTCTCPAVFASH